MALLSNLGCLNCLLPVFSSSHRSSFRAPSMPSSSYFTRPLDNFNHQPPFPSLTSLLSSIPKLLDYSYTSTGISNIKVIPHLTTSHPSPPLPYLPLRHSKDERHTRAAFFTAPINMVTKPLESIPPIRSHSCCLTQGLHHFISFSSLSHQPPIQLPYNLQFNLRCKPLEIL